MSHLPEDWVRGRMEIAREAARRASEALAMWAKAPLDLVTPQHLARPAADELRLALEALAPLERDA
jgi:hypothetical protein